MIKWNTLAFIVFILTIFSYDYYFSKLLRNDNKTLFNAYISSLNTKSLFSTSDMIKHLNPRVDPDIVSMISKNIDEYCYPFPREFIVSLIFRESTFNALAVSSDGCIGLMQINPIFHSEKIGNLKKYEIFYIRNNIRIGCEILKEFYSKSDGDIKDALSKYFGSKNKEYMFDIFNKFSELSVINNIYENNYLRLKF